jgi:hypothetical protein
MFQAAAMCRMAGKTGSPMSLGSMRASFDRLRMPGSRCIKKPNSLLKNLEIGASPVFLR